MNYIITNPTAVIGWTSKITGYSGHGLPIDRKSAELSVARLNRELPEIDHYLIPSNGPKLFQPL